MISKKVYKETRDAYQSAIDKVKWVQSRLTEHGFKCSINGAWDDNTEAQLRAFQKANRLTVDGIVGSSTEKALKAPKKVEVKHFRDAEFLCKCKGKYCKGLPTKGVSHDLLVLLENIRAEVRRLYGNDKVVIVNSGYRCPTWNKKVGGAKGSQHMSNPANAADIRVPGVTPKQLGVICDRLNPNGGVGLNGATIVHVDTRPKKARWYYN